MTEPTLGEVWWVNLEPAVGSEANKTRPSVVVSVPRFDQFGTRIVVPLTTWSERFENQPNRVHLTPSAANGLDFDSAADVLHTRSLSIRRFRFRSGEITPEDLERIANGLRLALGLDQ
jgi:mRNA interferase MazF